MLDEGVACKDISAAGKEDLVVLIEVVIDRFGTRIDKDEEVLEFALISP